MGVDFSDVLDGPDLLKIVKEVDPESIPQDVRAESLNGIAEEERARRGDWLAIWGGMSIPVSLHWWLNGSSFIIRLGDIRQFDCPVGPACWIEGRNRGGQRQARLKDIQS